MLRPIQLNIAPQASAQKTVAPTTIRIIGLVVCSNSSIVNIRPAMGALNTAARPAPPPADTSTFVNDLGALSQEPICHATEPPIWTEGPSAPNGNPLPIAITPESSLTTPTLRFIGIGLSCK